MELAKREDTFSLATADLESQRMMCELLMKTPHYAKMGPDGVYAIVAKARSIDMDPIEALNGALYYVNGRVGMSTEAMAARMRAHGHSIQKDPKSTNSCCILIGKRSDNGDQWITSFSIEDAKRAGIYNDRGPWGKYPSVMCYNRAMSMMYRQLTPDLSKGTGYTLDELKEIAACEQAPVAPDVKSVPAKMSEVVVDVVSKDQADELTVIFSECDPSFVEKVWHTLRKPPISIDTIDQLPASLFDRIRASALKNKQEYQAKLEEAEVLAYEEENELQSMEA